MDRFKAGLNPYFAMEVNLKDPTNFQTLLQVCQLYNRKLKATRMGVDTMMTVASVNVVPILNAPYPSSIVHGGQVFPNKFNSNITNQASLLMMRDVDHPRTCSRSEVEGLRTIGRIRNIPLDFRVFITISRNMCYQYHMFLKTQWKSLKSHLVIKLKFHEFKLVSHIYANFLNVNLTIHVNP